jgi:SAM-dependent methyltransferase
MLKARLESVRDSSFALLTLNYLLGQVRYRTGLKAHQSGATHSRHSPEQGANYIASVFRDYLDAGGLSVADLQGASVLEVGPGDNLGVAALFAAAGAKKVVCLDRFSSDRDETKNRDVYRTLVTKTALPPGLQLDRLFTPSWDLVPGMIEYRTDVPIELASQHYPHGSFQVIVSRAVLEHVFDVPAAWTSMNALLAPGGWMLHKIDFRNHGFYTTQHPLAYMKVPPSWWGLISSPDPTLNRQRMGAYERLAAESGYTATIGVTHLSSRTDEFKPARMAWVEGSEYTAEDVAFVESIRPQLAEPFRSMTTKELLVDGIFLAARKSR